LLLDGVSKSAGPAFSIIETAGIVISRLLIARHVLRRRRPSWMGKDALVLPHRGPSLSCRDPARRRRPLHARNYSRECGRGAGARGRSGANGGEQAGPNEMGGSFPASWRIQKSRCSACSGGLPDPKGHVI